MRRARRLMIGAAAAIAAVAVGDASPVAGDGGFRVTGTFLNGANEFPGPGDTDGAGAAAVVVNANRGRICYVLAVKHIAPATMAHIHIGPAGTAGVIVVNLDAPTDGFSAGCINNVDRTLAGQIVAMPDQYYVNVHNADFPAGAIRGQLG